MLCALCIGPHIASASDAKQKHEQAFGIVWRVQGRWFDQGNKEVLHNGDAVFPRALLLPDQDSGSHSITVLLPDGQRVLYACYLATDCARGFRVPELYREPEPFAVEMLNGVHALLSREPAQARANRSEESALPQFETLGVADREGHVVVKGLVASLSDGDYVYDLRPIAPAGAQQRGLGAQKKGSAMALAIPSAGLYDVTLYDALRRPRIDLLVGAAPQERATSLTKSFGAANALLADWNEDYQGWPMHELRRAYLESLFRDIKPVEVKQPSDIDEDRSISSTEEPAFSPKAGVFRGDTAVALKCATPGAVIHYTVDGAQPLSNSAVYGGPIMVKGTGLTIKAFASAPGKKDSPVVTGIFRIGDE